MGNINEGKVFYMKLYIDADGCPVVDVTIRVAKQLGVEVVILCDTSHVFQKEKVQTITVSKGADSVDFAIVNLLSPGDIVVTQDYGLAAMCLARKAVPIRQDGMVYTNENIDALLLFRHTSKEIRNGGGRLKGNPKRNKKTEDLAFAQSLTVEIQRGQGG